MHRVDGPGATVGNLFTEGNPSLSIPATVVTDDIMNDIQEEICNTVEDAGITLVKGTQTQLRDAIFEYIGRGGADFQQALSNNAPATNVTSLLFDSNDIKAVQIHYEAYRQTDANNEMEQGIIYLSHRTATNTWELSQDSFFDDSGVTFTVLSTGQVQYATTNLTGANYSGTLRITAIRKFRQTIV